MTRILRNLAVLTVAAGAAGCGPDPTTTDRLHDDAEAGLIVNSDTTQTWSVRSNFLSESSLVDVLTFLENESREIDAMATAPNGSWVIVSGSSRWYGASFPAAARDAVDDYLSAGQTIVAVDFNAAGGWVVVTNLQQAYGGAVPQALKDKIADYRANGWAIQDVDITSTAYVVVGNSNLVSWNASLDNGLEQVLADRLASKRKVRQVDIGFDGRWVVVADQEAATKSATAVFRNRLRTVAANKDMISRVMFGVGNDYLVVSHGSVVANPFSAIERIEYNVGGVSLWQAMSDASVPGLSIAIIQDNQVVVARSYGVLNADEQTPVLASTPFDLASLTKFASSLVMLKLADQGKVNLFADILTSPGSNIATWKVAGLSDDSVELGMPGTPLPSGITAARLMRHRAGMQAQGGSPPAHPNNWNDFDGNSGVVSQLLGLNCSSASGCAQSSNDWAWVTSPVNGPSDYSNQNFLVTQAIAEDATGERAVKLYEQLFITPMGLSNTSARIPLHFSFEQRMAWQHDVDGTPRGFRTLYPYSFAGGLNASAADYAELVILALNGGVDSSGVQRVSAARINSMLDGVDSSAGFGMFFGTGTNALEGTDRTFSHSGSHTKRSRTKMCGNPTRGEGIVVLMNRGKDTVGDQLLTDILNRFTAVRGWPVGC